MTPIETFIGNERDAFGEERPGRLGRLPSKGDTRALLFRNLGNVPAKLPAETISFWKRRATFPVRSFGNLDYGSCTRSKQAVAAMRMERLETRRTPTITDEEVIRVYTDMSARLYGGGDNGAYETDALSEWRKPEHTIRDTKGRALTIDAYVRINPYDHDEVRASLVAAGPHGIAVCLNLPWAFRSIRPPADWDIPDGQSLVGEWMPGSWGGHSMWSFGYDPAGAWLDHTWLLAPQRITWRAMAAYMDEAHVVIDSLDYWRRKKPEARRLLDLAGIKAAVNKVSSHKLA
jgi:hypothetical protein